MTTRLFDASTALDTLFVDAELLVDSFALAGGDACPAWVDIFRREIGTLRTGFNEVYGAAVACKWGIGVVDPDGRKVGAVK